MGYKYSENCEKEVTDKIECDVLKRLSPRRGAILTELVTEVAMYYGVDSRTVRRRVQTLIEKGMAYVANPNQKPYMIFSVENTESDCKKSTSSMTIEEALFVMFTKEFGQKVMSASSFQKLTNTGFFKVAEEMVQNAKRRNPSQKILGFEKVSTCECLYQCYINSNIEVGVIEIIKEALYKDLELELILKDLHEPIFVKPEQLQVVDAQPILQVKQLNYPNSLNYVIIEDILNIFVVEYCAFRAPEQMRRVA